MQVGKLKVRTRKKENKNKSTYPVPLSITTGGLPAIINYNIVNVNQDIYKIGSTSEKDRKFTKREIFDFFGFSNFRFFCL
jgi:hypothetical protein